MTGDNKRVDDRYGAPSRWRGILIGLPIALFMLVLGGYWTLLSWDVWGEANTSGAVDFAGPILAGLGVALGYVVLRPRR